MLIMLLLRVVWHRMAVCSAHGHAGSIASPGGGPLSFRACSKASTAIATAVLSPPSSPPPQSPPASLAHHRRQHCRHRPRLRSAATTITLTTAAVAAAIAATALTTPPCICLNHTYGAFYNQILGVQKDQAGIKCRIENQAKRGSRPLKIRNFPAARPTMVGAQRVLLFLLFPPIT